MSTENDAAEAAKPRRARAKKAEGIDAGLIGATVQYTPKAGEIEVLKERHGVDQAVLAAVVTAVQAETVSLRVLLPGGGDLNVNGVTEGEGPHTFQNA